MRVPLLYRTGKIYLAYFYLKGNKLKFISMLQISDVRGSWACMNLAKQMSHIIKICISTINGKKRCSKNCGLFHNLRRIKLDNNKKKVFKPTARIKD